MRKFVYIMIFCSSVLQVVAQEQHTLKIVCNNKLLIDNLECCLTLRDNFGCSKKFYYPAVYGNKSDCYFTFPDSIFEKYSALDIIRRDSLKASCSFRIANEVDTTFFISSYLFVEDVDTMTVNVKCEKQDTIKNYIEIEYTIEKPSQEIFLSLIGVYNDHVKYRKESGEQLFARYKELIAQYPDSRSLLQAVYGYYYALSINQLVELKSLFSDKLLQTYWGKELSALIDSGKGKFKNNFFLNSCTGEQESVILNPDKHSFVIFSASWCAPCHKLIPLLKELYSKKKDVMDFVYISLDEQKTQNAWKQLLEKEQIPWRALSVDDVIKTRQEYKVPVIPYSYLVTPAGNFQKLDIRDEKDLQRLENLN